MVTDTEGIVLRQVKAAGGRRMISLFSKKFGKISVGTSLNEGGRNKTALAVRAFSYGRYELFKSRDNYNLNNGQVIKSYYGIGEDLDKYMAASYVLELTDKLLPEEMAQPRIFSLLAEFLEELEKREKKHGTLVMAYLIKVLDILGAMPRTDACACCGRPLKPSEADNAEPANANLTNARHADAQAVNAKPTNVEPMNAKAVNAEGAAAKAANDEAASDKAAEAGPKKSGGRFEKTLQVPGEREKITRNRRIFFSTEEGGIVCEDCAKELRSAGDRPLIYKADFGIIDILRYFQKTPLAAFEKIALDDKLQNILQEMIKGYISYHMDIKGLKSESFF